MMNEIIPAPNRGRQKWAPLFYPKEWWRENDDHDIESNILTKRVLKANAKTAVDMRQLMLRRAKEAAGIEKDVFLNGFEASFRLSRKLMNRGEDRAPMLKPIKPSEYKEQTSPDSRRRGRGRPKLTAGNKIRIIHKVIFQLQPVKEVAKEFRITP